MLMKLVIRNYLEKLGINLSKNSSTLGLTPISEIRDLLFSLRPKTNGVNLIRIGGAGDGGYLLPDDFVGIEECFSPGSNLLWNFERELSERFHIKSFICDSIDQKPRDLTENQDFTEAWVGPATDESSTISLSDWIEIKSPGDSDLILQMDIEGAEFQTLLSVSTKLLNRFRIIVIEFHFLEALKNRWAFNLMYTPIFSKLLENFDVVHLHPNNCCGTWTVGDLEFPRIIEVTFHRKDRAISDLKNADIKNQLDYPCVPSNKELRIEWLESSNIVKVDKHL